MKDPIIIRQRLTAIDHDIYHLNEERKKLEAELARVGLQAVPYPSDSDASQEATLEEILKGDWHFKNPTPEARRVFEEMGVPLEGNRDFWDSGFLYAEWYADKAYTSESLEAENLQRELILDNGKLYFA